MQGKLEKLSDEKARAAAAGAHLLLNLAWKDHNVSIAAAAGSKSASKQVHNFISHYSYVFQDDNRVNTGQ